MKRSSFYSFLPSVTEVDQYLKAQGLPFGKPVRQEVHGTLQGLRAQIAETPEESLAHDFAFTEKSQVLVHVAEAVVRRNTRSLRQIINATGVVVHTNLGRAPLSKDLVESVLPLLWSYTNLEYDLETGKRGSRGDGVRNYLRLLSGADDAIAVNNNAAAVYLMLIALAPGQEVIVSRGELIEIGGSFRVPDIMKAAGVTLVEVGTTNRTRIEDYADAITDNTAALMKVHPSNYAIQGFTEETSMKQIAQLAKQRGKLSLHDLGSGNFYRFQQPALRGLSSVQQEVNTGADLVSFSGDKLLGSTQAGVVVGTKPLIRKLSKHPLYRAFRLDKVTMALLECHLAAYFDIESLPQHIPTIGFLEQTAEEIREKAQHVFDQLKIPVQGWTVELQAGSSLTGGGALPEVYLDSFSIAIRHETKTEESLQRFLRNQEIPIIARIQNDWVCLDFRAVFPQDFPTIVTSIHQLFENA